MIAAISFRTTEENGKYPDYDENFLKEVEKGNRYILENIYKLDLSHL